MNFFVISFVLSYFCSVVHTFYVFDYLYTDHEIEYFRDDQKKPDMNVTSFKITQPLDHFNTSLNEPWGMRCFKSVDLWKPNGPVYLVIGGEGNANEKHLTSGMVYELAKETHGALFMSEHRFYGRSLPRKKFDLINLKYLSAKQALADIAALLNWIKIQKQFKTSKVVVVGGSYAGNLATWLKLLYPTLVDAAIASSAPLLAKLDFYEYLETVSDVYRKYGTEGCWDFIHAQFEEYEEALKTEEGIENLKKSENICKNSSMSTIENQQYFFYHKVGEFMLPAQYGFVHNITLHCKNISNSSKIISQNHLIDRFDRKFKHWNKKEDCLEIDLFQDVEKIKQGKSNYTHWFYQKCNEFGYAKTSSSDKHPFTNNMHIETFYMLCSMVFGDKFNKESIEKSVEHTNQLYQGLKPNVKNVVFVNGELDPWHRLGILESLSEDAPAIFIPRASHCKDLHSQSENDPPELIEARRQIKQLIKKWIGFKE